MRDVVIHTLWGGILNAVGDVTVDPVENALIVDLGDGQYIKFHWPNVRYFQVGQESDGDDDDQ